MLREYSNTPIAKEGTLTACLFCSPSHKKALLTGITLCEAFLTSNITLLEAIAKEKKIEISTPLWRDFFCIAHTEAEGSSRLTLLNKLHAVLEFEKSEYITLSRDVSLTLLRGIELSLAFGMKQWGKFPTLFLELGIVLNQDQRDALNVIVSHHKAVAPALGLSPEVNPCFLLCYEISKVLKRFWSNDQASFSVWRDGLTVRYSQEPAPYCLDSTPDV